MPTQKVFVTGDELPALEAGTLRLYSNRFCPYAQRARIVLVHKNIPYETINNHLKQKPEWITRLNPLGTVPILQKDDLVVTESIVIMEYLDEVYPGEKIVPSDPYTKAKDKMFMERFSKIVTQYYGILMGMRDGNDFTEKLAGFASAYKVVEEELKQRNTKYFGGDKPMLIDLAMWPHIERMVAMGTKIPQLKINGDSLPLFAAYIERMKSVPAIKDTMFTPETHMAFFDTIKQGSANYDYGLEE